MPTRYVRSQILESRRYHSVGPLERLAFLELLLLADDFGVVPLHQIFLLRRTTAFSGLSEDAMAAKIDSMERADLIRTYVEQGQALCFIPRNGFLRRAKKCQHPLPDFEATQNKGRFNELKKLTQNCSADAMQPHSTRTASVMHPYPTPTPTTTSTPTQSTQSAVLSNVDPAAEVWSFGVEMLCRDGEKPLADAAARSLIGSLLKTWSPETTLNALRAAVGTKAPPGYVQAILKKKRKLSEQESDEKWD